MASPPEGRGRSAPLYWGESRNFSFFRLNTVDSDSRYSIIEVTQEEIKMNNEFATMLNNLKAEYAAIPPQARLTAYAKHLLRMIEQTREAAQQNADMNEDKSFSRCR